MSQSTDEEKKRTHRVRIETWSGVSRLWHKDLLAPAEAEPLAEAVQGETHRRAVVGAACARAAALLLGLDGRGSPSRLNLGEKQESRAWGGNAERFHELLGFLLLFLFLVFCSSIRPSSRQASVWIDIFMSSNM